MNTAARLIASILVAGSLLAACGDDEATTTSGNGGAAVPAADTAFDGLETALESQGLTVAKLPATSLSGAETGVDIPRGQGRHRASVLELGQGRGLR